MEFSYFSLGSTLFDRFRGNGRRNKKVNKETISFFGALRRIFFLEISSCKQVVCVSVWMKLLRYLIFSMIIKFFTRVKTLALGAVVIDNKSVSFLIKCPMPVIEKTTTTTRNVKETNLYPKKMNTKQKTRHTMSLIFFFILHGENLAKICFLSENSFVVHPICLSLPSESKESYKWTQKERVARGLMTFEAQKQTC